MAAEPGPGPGHDPELEELLESALDDFEQSRPPPPPGSSSPPSPAADSAKERFFQELFEGELAAQAATEFQEAMEELARQEPQLVEQFQKLSEAAGKVGSDVASQQEFTSCLKETLSGLAKNSNDLQNSPGSEEELAKALEGLGLEEGGGDGVLPVMRSIMESLLSKDVLYPSLKEITEKYPEWLRQHGPALAPEQRERFRAQQALMLRICAELERERPGEPEGQRRERFETLLELMHCRTWATPPRSWWGTRPPDSTWSCRGGSVGSSAGSCRGTLGSPRPLTRPALNESLMRMKRMKRSRGGEGGGLGPPPSPQFVGFLGGGGRRGPHLGWCPPLAPTVSPIKCW
ncbi:peroxisomal biogenesis factor 19 isoform X2 [Aphelocoma coerulescens]|uniref:peroxisomal biogenesis factor 19 isoform X2 n=1 Tax=Aphelocoma coerulescens TaxID=39617 RepID=UPI0036053E66